MQTGTTAMTADLTEFEAPLPPGLTSSLTSPLPAHTLPCPPVYFMSPYGTPSKTVVELAIEAMRLVTAVPKDGHNSAQNFPFRGIDGVINGVGPALRKVGLVLVPNLVLVKREVVEVGQRRTPMDSTYVEVIYVLLGPSADALATRVPGLAMDSGDKGITKAMSVAWRTALIQLFALPTQEPDPDSSVYERAPLLTDQAMACREAVLAASTVEELREIYADARAIPGLGGVEVPDRDGHPMQLATLITARGEQLAAAQQNIATAEPAVEDSSTPPADSTQDLDPNTRLASNGQLQQLSILLAEAGVSTRERRLQAVSALVRKELTSSGELTMVQARDAIKKVKAAIDAGAPDAWLADLLENAGTVAS
jgi:hypothetical protein